MKIRLLTVSKAYLKSVDRDTLRILAQEGQFEVGLVCPALWQGNSSEKEPEETKGSFCLERLPLGFAGGKGFHFYRGLGGALKRFRPDIVKIDEDPSSMAAFQAIRIAKSMGVRSILYATDNIDRKPLAPRRWLERMVFNHVHAAAVDSDDAADILRRKGYAGQIVKLPRRGVNERIIPVSGLGLAQKDAMKRELELPADRRWILYSGPLTPERGVHDLLEACYYLGKQGIAAGLLVIGDGPCLEELRLSAKRLQGSVVVKFKSAAALGDISRWIIAADVLCLPSQTRTYWKEPFAPVLVEAMAAGTVVVGSDSGETPRVIGSCGLTFAERNPRELFQKIKTLLTDGACYDSLQQKALAHVRANYTNHVLAGRLGVLCLDVMQTPTSP